MDSVITLGINKMELDWGKYSKFSNYSCLFQIKDFGQKIPYVSVKYIRGVK